MSHHFAKKVWPKKGKKKTITISQWAKAISGTGNALAVNQADATIVKVKKKKKKKH